MQIAYVHEEVRKCLYVCDCVCEGGEASEEDGGPAGGGKL